MTDYLENLFMEFDQSALRARQERDKYIIIDRIYESIADLTAFPFPDVLSKILALVERYPEIDYGGPGPFGSFIETKKIDQYAQPMLDSLYRQPSTQVVGWLDRAMSDNDFQDGNTVPPELKAEFKKCLLDVVSNQKATEDCRDFANICLKDLRR